MSRIPAASINDLDLQRIQSRFPQEAREIARIGGLLDTGRESVDDIVQLSKLLVVVGETPRAESLLRHNIVDEGDALHNTYISLFGPGAHKAFDAAIGQFSADFAVALTRQSKNGFLRETYQSCPRTDQKITDERIANILRGPATVEFQFESDGTTADVSSDLPELFHNYILLQLRNNGWTFISGHP